VRALGFFLPVPNVFSDAPGVEILEQTVDTLSCPPESGPRGSQRPQRLIEQVAAPVQYPQQRCEEQPRIDTAFAVARMDEAIETAVLSGGAEQAWQKPRKRDDYNPHREVPSVPGAAVLHPSPKCRLFMSRRHSSICMRWR
jgi:hypothetical protein